MNEYFPTKNHFILIFYLLSITFSTEKRSLPNDADEIYEQDPHILKSRPSEDKVSSLPIYNSENNAKESSNTCSTKGDRKESTFQKQAKLEKIKSFEGSYDFFKEGTMSYEFYNKTLRPVFEKIIRELKEIFSFYKEKRSLDILSEIKSFEEFLKTNKVLDQLEKNIDKEHELTEDNNKKNYFPLVLQLYSSLFDDDCYLNRRKRFLNFHKNPTNKSVTSYTSNYRFKMKEIKDELAKNPENEFLFDFFLCFKEGQRVFYSLKFSDFKGSLDEVEKNLKEGEIDFIKFIKNRNKLDKSSCINKMRAGTFILPSYYKCIQKLHQMITEFEEQSYNENKNENENEVLDPEKNKFLKEQNYYLKKYRKKEKKYDTGFIGYFFDYFYEKVKEIENKIKNDKIPDTSEENPEINFSNREEENIEPKILNHKLNHIVHPKIENEIDNGGIFNSLEEASDFKFSNKDKEITESKTVNFDLSNNAHPETNTKNGHKEMVLNQENIKIYKRLKENLENFKKMNIPPDHAENYNLRNNIESIIEDLMLLFSLSKEDYWAIFLSQVESFAEFLHQNKVIEKMENKILESNESVEGNMNKNYTLSLFEICSSSIDDYNYIKRRFHLVRSLNIETGKEIKYNEAKYYYLSGEIEKELEKIPENKFYLKIFRALKEIQRSFHSRDFIDLPESLDEYEKKLEEAENYFMKFIRDQNKTDELNCLCNLIEIDEKLKKNWRKTPENFLTETKEKLFEEVKNGNLFFARNSDNEIKKYEEKKDFLKKCQKLFKKYREGQKKKDKIFLEKIFDYFKEKLKGFKISDQEITDSEDPVKFNSSTKQNNYLKEK